MALYFRHRSSLAHETGAHPENASRIEAIEGALEAAGWPGLERLDPAPAPREWLLRVHDEGHLRRLEQLAAAGGGAIDPDTIVAEGSWEAARRAAGAAGEAAERLLAGEAEMAFCALRPPGHHAEPARAMGFCLLNNAAIGAEHALACGAERVAIFDWDVHHGNGTERAFADRGDVLYVSVHQSPLYPGTGPADETGTGAGRGHTVNLPVPAGTAGAGLRGLTEHVVGPLLRAYSPGLIIVSAGYDAHREDPLAGCLLEDDDYGELAALVRAAAGAAGAPVLFCLEGGYAPGALARSVLATVNAFAEGREPVPAELTPLVRAARSRVAATSPWERVLSAR